MSWNAGKVCNTVWTTSRQSKHFHWKVSFLLFSLGLSHFLFFSPRLYNICFFFANEQKCLSTKIQDKFYVIHISIKLQSFNNNTSGFLMLNFQMIATIRWKVSDVFSFTKQIFIHEKERWWWKDIIQMYAFFTIPMMNMYPGSGRPINSLLYII